MTKLFSPSLSHGIQIKDFHSFKIFFLTPAWLTIQLSFPANFIRQHMFFRDQTWLLLSWMALSSIHFEGEKYQIFFILSHMHTVLQEYEKSYPYNVITGTYTDGFINFLLQSSRNTGSMKQSFRRLSSSCMRMLHSSSCLAFSPFPTFTDIFSS